MGSIVNRVYYNSLQKSYWYPPDFYVGMTNRLCFCSLIDCLDLGVKEVGDVVDAQSLALIVC